MVRICLSAAIALGVAMPAHADVIIKQSTESKGLGLSGKSVGTSYIKGNKMRVDTVTGDKTQTMIFDVDAQKLYIFDSKKKEADLWDMAVFADEVSKGVDASSLKAAIKPNGQTRQIGGRAAAGYDMDISIQSSMGGSKEMSLTVSLVGPMWVVQGAPGTEDYVRFYKGAVAKGWVFSDPRAAKAQPGQAKAMAEMYNQIAALGGLPFETDLQIKLGGSGPMAGLMARMGNLSMLTTVESVDTSALGDEVFAPPAGYKLSQKK